MTGSRRTAIRAAPRLRQPSELRKLSDELGAGAKIAGASAIFLLLFMGVFDWFQTSGDAVNAWQSFTLIDLGLLLAAAAGIALVVTSIGAPNGPPLGLAFATASLGLLGLTLVVFRAIDPPDLDTTAISQAVDVFAVGEAEPRVGLLLGVLATIGVVVGGWLATGVRKAEPVADSPSRPPRAPSRPGRTGSPEWELPGRSTAAQPAVDRAARRRRSQSSSD